MREKIIENKAKCKLCGDEIVSFHVHDYKHCKCGEIMVDGGNEYLRRGWRNRDNFIELSDVVQQPVSVWLAEKLASYWLADTKTLTRQISQHLRFGATLELEIAIRKEIPDLSVEQYDKLKALILRELTGEK